MSFSDAFMVFLLLATLAIASPTTSFEVTISRHFKRQVATTTSLILPLIPTITIDILQPPYVSLHSITARNAQSSEPTTATPLVPFNPIATVTVPSHHETKLTTYGLQTTTISSALHHWTEVPVASSANSFTKAVDINQTKWDCTAICGALNEDGECSLVTHCLDMGDGKVKGGNPHQVNGAGKTALSGHIGGGVAVAMLLVIGAWMLL